MYTASTPSKRPHDQSFTETNGKGKWQKTAGRSSPSQPLKSSPGVVFRILCPASKAGGIIGKGGSIISQIRQETGVKVRVEESVPGCDERVVVILGGSDKDSEVINEPNRGDGDIEANEIEKCNEQKDSTEDDEKKDNVPAEDTSKSEKEFSSLEKALVLVFERMLETDTGKDGEEEENNKPSSFNLRLLVLSSQVGCLLGKGGSVIKQMSSESGAQIRGSPRDKAPPCALPSDELVQITGDVDQVRKALLSVAQQLLENPPKDHDPFAANATGPSSHSFGHSISTPEAYPPPHHSFNARGVSHVAGPRDFHEGGMPGRMRPPDLITFRLLCLDAKVGGVIGKGGSIIKGLQQETGCEIKVLEGIPDSEDRIIIVSGPAHPEDRISVVQDAVLRVQTRIDRALPVTEGKEKTMLARLLVPSNQIGCLLGKGGAIMAEMRKSTGAYIRILGKDQVPKCASENEEVVQIHGDHEIVQEALLRITSRLRNHFFRDVFPSMDHPSNPAFLDQMPPFPPYMGRREMSPPFHAYHNFDRMGGPPPHAGFHPHDDHPPFMHTIHRPGMPLHPPERKPWGPQGILDGGGPVGMPDYGGSHQRRMLGYGGFNHPAVITNTTVEVVVPRSVVPAIYGEDGACIREICQISDAKVTVSEPKPGAPETVIIISGTPEQTHAAQSLVQAFVMSEREATSSFA